VWRIFRTKRKIGGNCIMKNLIMLPNIMKAIKSRDMRWVGHKTRKVEMRNAYNILVKKREVAIWEIYA
jgi:hypothetical protein